MNKSNSVKLIDRTNLTEQTIFRLDKISEIEYYFYQEIDQRKSCSRKLSKYVAAFDYIDKVLIVLSTASGRVSICSFASIIGAQVGIASASFALVFSLRTGITNKLLSITRRKKRKSMIKFLCWLKVNSIASKP